MTGTGAPPISGRLSSVPLAPPTSQGLGIGPRLSDKVASTIIARGLRYMSRTAHPRFGAYRKASPLWEPTTANETASTTVGRDHISQIICHLRDLTRCLPRVCR